MAKKVNEIIWAIGETTDKMVNAMIDACLATGKVFHERLHIAMCNAVVHMLVDGQSTPFAKLFNGLNGTAVSTLAVQKWVETMAPVTLSEGEDGNVVITFKKGWQKLDKDTAITKMRRAPAFWIMVPPPSAFKGMNFQDELNRLIERARKMEEAQALGVIKRGGKVKELSPDELKTINLDGFRAAQEALARHVPALN